MFKHINLSTIIQYVILSTVLNAVTISSDDTTPIPEAATEVQAWFDTNVKPFVNRKGTLNADLEAAEANPKIIKVRKDGSGDFDTLGKAITSIPTPNKQRVIVDIGPGTYNEKITIKDMPFVSFIGPPDKATIEFDATAFEFGPIYSATLHVLSDFFVGSNLIIKNDNPMLGKGPGGEALAFRISGNMAAFYNCKFVGFQNTLNDDNGSHFFKDCHIEGTIDFIFGTGKSIYLNTEIEVIQAADENSVVTAQLKGNVDDTGYSFVHCNVTGEATRAFLGRARMEAPKVVFAYSIISAAIGAEGWSNYDHPEREPKIFFGEYKNSGPGAVVNGRVKYSKQLSDAEVNPFLSLGFIKGSSWLLPPPKL